MKKRKKNQVKDTDGVQDTLLQNMALWPITYFKLKKLEKMAGARSLGPWLLYLSSQKQVIKLSYQMYPPCTRKKTF